VVPIEKAEMIASFPSFKPFDRVIIKLILTGDKKFIKSPIFFCFLKLYRYYNILGNVMQHFLVLSNKERIKKIKSLLRK
jgi:hypothetical protein